MTTRLSSVAMNIGSEAASRAMATGTARVVRGAAAGPRGAGAGVPPEGGAGTGVPGARAPGAVVLVGVAIGTPVSIG